MMKYPDAEYSGVVATWARAYFVGTRRVGQLEQTAQDAQWTFGSKESKSHVKELKATIAEVAEALKILRDLGLRM